MAVDSINWYEKDFARKNLFHRIEREHSLSQKFIFSLIYISQHIGMLSIKWNVQELLPYRGRDCYLFLVAGGSCYAWITKQPSGTKEMMEISNAVKVGAAAFLKREMKIIVPVAIGLSANYRRISSTFKRNCFCSRCNSFCSSRN